MIIIRLSRQFSKIAKELRNNPEFDKIHPEFLQHKPPTTIHRQSQEIQFFKSLLRYKDTNKQGYEDALHQNFKTFVEGHNSPRGALKYLSEEDKKTIQIQITRKLQELEDTGLSREEILTNGAHKGIPLCYDSFFQLLKNNEAARLVYLSPGEEFTVQKVIDIALRQDLGKDQFNVPIKKYSNNMQLQNYHKQKDVLVNTKDHMEHVNELVVDEVIYHHKPKRQRPTRRVNNYDIHWRNTEFLIQFLNRSSKIKNRHFTNLSETQQKKVARTIKTARQMLLLPDSATIQPFHKKSLTSLEDDIEEFARRKINLENGQIYFETPLQRRERSVEHQTMLSFNGEHEINVGVERPNNLSVIKANVYAEKLKAQELEKEGLKLTKEQQDEQTYKFVGNDLKFEQIRQEQLLKREIQTEIEEKQGEFKEEFQTIKQKIEQIPTHLISQAIISEQTLQTQKIEELIIKPKKVYTVQESRTIIDEVKARLQK